MRSRWAAVTWAASATKSASVAGVAMRVRARALE